MKKKIIKMLSAGTFLALALSLNAQTVFGIEIDRPESVGSFGNLVNISVTRNGESTRTYSISNPSEIAAYLESTGRQSEFDSVSEIIIISRNFNDGLFSEVEVLSDYEMIEQYLLWSLEVTETGRENNTIFRNSPLRNSSHGPGGTATMTISESLAVQHTTSFGVSGELLTASLGFSHTATHSVSDTHTSEVPAGRRATLTAWAYHQRIDFDVHERNIITQNRTRLGAGWSARPTGVRFEIVVH